MKAEFQADVETLRKDGEEKFVALRRGDAQKLEGIRRNDFKKFEDLRVALGKKRAAQRRGDDRKLRETLGFA